MRHVAMVAAIGAAWCVASAPAQAHLMPRQQGTINVRDSAVFCVFSIPASALTGWDRDHDGRMSVDEFAAHRTAVTQQVDAGIRLRSGDDAGRRDFLQPSLDVDEADPLAARGATHLLVLVRQSFGTVPAEVQLTLALFGTARDEQTFLIKATRGGSPEVGILSRSDQSRIFFAPMARIAILAPWTRVAGAPLALGALLLGLVAVAAWLTSRRVPVIGSRASATM